MKTFVCLVQTSTNVMILNDIWDAKMQIPTIGESYRNCNICPNNRNDFSTASFSPSASGQAGCFVSQSCVSVERDIMLCLMSAVACLSLSVIAVLRYSVVSGVLLCGGGRLPRQKESCKHCQAA